MQAIGFGGPYDGHSVGMLGKVVWKLTAGSLVVVSGVLARRALDAGWRKSRGSDPPKNPESPLTTWPEALGWAAASGVAAAVARTLARRTAASGWERATGHLPPGVRA